MVIIIKKVQIARFTRNLLLVASNSFSEMFMVYCKNLFGFAAATLQNGILVGHIRHVPQTLIEYCRSTPEWGPIPDPKVGNYRLTDPMELLYRLFLPKPDFSVRRVGNRTLIRSKSQHWKIMFFFLQLTKNERRTDIFWKSVKLQISKFDENFFRKFNRSVFEKSSAFFCEDFCKYLFEYLIIFFNSVFKEV